MFRGGKPSPESVMSMAKSTILFPKALEDTILENLLGHQSWSSLEGIEDFGIIFSDVDGESAFGFAIFYY